MGRLTKYSNDMIRNKAINIIRKLSDKNGLNGDELSLVNAFCLIERTENKALKQYENLEEQGKLLKLPCAVGDTVYVIPSSENFGINIVNGHEENNRVYEQIVDHVEMRGSGYLLSTCDGMSCVIEESYKKTWFTDKKEAEVKLKELERYWKMTLYDIGMMKERIGK